MNTKFTFFWIAFLVFTSWACQDQSKESPQNQKPNILFLLADDLGYGELGCYGQEIIQTPTLDKLAKQGMRFTDFYAGNAVCSPSRAVLMTGKSSSFNTIRGNSGSYSDDRWMRVALKKDEITIAEMLSDAGYQTGFVGKWHLGDPNDLSTWAHNRGFDYAVQEQWASRFGGSTFTPNYEYVNGREDSIYYDDHQWNCKDEFRTEIAFKYLDKIDKNKPFFLFMSYRAPHAHEPYIHNKELYAEKGWQEKERKHAAKISLLDIQVGRMLDKLEQMGELDNTLVLFTSDNGPHGEGGHDYEFFNSNGALKGYKRDVYEGGIRVPLIAWWKGNTQAGFVSNHLSGFQDIMPTLAQVAGLSTPEQSTGNSILPVLLGEEQKMPEYLNWELQLDGWSRTMPKGGFRQSARIDNWKGVRYGVESEIEIYNLNTDISESNDVAKDNPALVKKMNQLFEESRNETDGFPYGGVVQDYKPKDKFDLKE